MYPIIDLISHSDENYLNYLRRKTGFILSKKDPMQVRWLWIHLLHHSNLHRLPNNAGLTEVELSVLNYTLLNFGYLTAKQVTAEALEVEKKYLWLFKHPSGGMFIPLEIIKSLLVNNAYLNKNYLFTLYYRIRHKEQKNYISLFGDEAKSQYHFKDEKSLLDSTLMLYIRLSSYHQLNTLDETILLRKGRILHSPFSFFREEDKNIEIEREHNLQDFFPEKPVNLWHHLEAFFPDMKTEANDWYNLMKTGRKSFFRSLGLLSPVKVKPWIYLFRFAYFVPVFNSDFHNNANPDNIRVVTPQEVRQVLAQQQENRLKQIPCLSNL